MKYMRATYLLLLLIACGSAFRILSHSMQITIAEDGAADVIEKYDLFLHPNEYAIFENLTARRVATTELWLWQRYWPQITIHAKGERQYLMIIPKRGERPQITIEYRLKELAQKSGEEGRYEIREVRADRFAFYDSEKKMFKLPINTLLKIRIADPRESRRERIEKYIEVVPKSVFGEAVVANQHVEYTLRGELTTPSLEIRIKREKRITERLGGQLSLQIYDLLTRNTTSVGVLIIIAVLVIIYRRPIARMIIESFAGVEEAEPPKKEI